MKKVILGQNKIAYLREGKSGKPKLLMLHGLFVNSGYFKKTMEYLKNDFDILAPDFPGFGLSDRFKNKPHTLNSYVRATIDLCNFLEFKPFSLVGASLGGMVSILLASKYPSYIEKVVIQGTPWNKTCYKLRFTKRFLARLSRNGGIVNLAAGVKGRVNGRISTGTFLKALEMFDKRIFTYEKKHGKVLYSLKTMDLKVTAEIWNNLKDEDLSTHARKIEKPTLIIVGDKDATVLPLKVQLLSRIIKGSKFKLIKGGSHALFWDCPKRLAIIIKKFL